MDRICIMAGPEHVIIATNECFDEAVGRDVLGQPAREAFVGFERYQALMDDTYATGRTHEDNMDAAGDLGVWVSVPRYLDGRIVGVATGFRPTPVLLSPELRPLEAPAV